MSDEQTINLPRRKVVRLDGNYHVAQYFNETGWIVDGRGYAHSTSAYAKLGRLVQKDTIKETVSKD